MMTAESIAKALGGRKVGSAWMVRCLVHQDREPSLSVADGNDGKVLVHCHAGCEQHEVIAALRARGVWNDARRAGSNTIGSYPGKANWPDGGNETVADTLPSRHADDVARTRRALRIWSETVDPRGTPVWRHLVARGIALGELPSRIHTVLRWHPHCPWGADGVRHGCMVALWTDAVSGEPRAIHRTAITHAGEKVGRKTLGPNAGCVIRLWPDEAVDRGLIIGEGIETTLAAATRVQHRGTLLTPAWATGDAGHLEKFPVLPGIEALTVLVDHDENGRGQQATAECAQRWAVAGREVTQLIPRIPGEDFADLVGERP
jgi:putative DNA primase/helicase